MSRGQRGAGKLREQLSAPFSPRDLSASGNGRMHVRIHHDTLARLDNCRELLSLYPSIVVGSDLLGLHVNLFRGMSTTFPTFPWPGAVSFLFPWCRHTLVGQESREVLVFPWRSSGRSRAPQCPGSGKVHATPLNMVRKKCGKL